VGPVFRAKRCASQDEEHWKVETTFRSDALVMKPGG
jgi:hypothetical protein